jgi:CubicO group peptidase (beta-lactamase class C family)
MVSLIVAGLLLLGAEVDVARHVEEARRAWEVPGVAVAVVKDDKVIYLAGHGVRELGKPEPVTPRTSFQIASTTKAFTTTALAMLVDEGKLSWDDPVRKHLDYFRLADPHADALVTVRDLVTHRTGLPRHDLLWVRTGFGREELIRRMAYAQPTASFREKYQYQNILFTAAGEVAGKVSGLGWDGLVEQRIFAPLDMRDSATRYAEMVQRENRAMPHVKTKVNPWGNYDNIGGAGSIASSAQDLSQWVRMQLNGGEFEGKRLVSAAQLGETHSPQMVNRLVSPTRELQPEFTQTTYGLGWAINHYRGEMLVMHAGVLSGFRALVTMAPRQKLGIVVLANQNGTNLPEALTNTLLDEYLGLAKTRDWNAHMLGIVKANEAKARQEQPVRKMGTKPSLEFGGYVGSFHEPAYGEVKVSLKEGKLRAEWAAFQGDLEHWHYDTWKVKGNGSLADVLLSFELNEKGEAVRLKLFGQTFGKR